VPLLVIHQSRNLTKLSYGYVLLATQVASALAGVGFDPYIGYLHASRYGKPALALDIMEEFRPVIVDSQEIITHPVFEYKVSYRRCIEVQARLLGKYLIGEVDEYTAFTVR
jgi:CRISPR-associated protein Cas1